jgi:hypothetical protein
MQEVPHSIPDLFSKHVHELGRAFFNFYSSDLAPNHSPAWSAVRQAVLFVRTRGVEIEGMQKTCPGLGNDRDIVIVQDRADKSDGAGAYGGIGRAVEGQQLRQHLICGVQMVGVERGGKRQHPCVPLVSGVEEGAPVERIDEEPPHGARFGVP